VDFKRHRSAEMTTMTWKVLEHVYIKSLHLSIDEV
jgi:hypothetical protein